MRNDSKHLVVAISGHGYGHAVMTAPLVKRLHQTHPELKITLRSAVAPEFLRHKFDLPFEYRHEQVDFGLVMHNAFEIDLEQSFARYRHIHRDWRAQIEAEKQTLRQMQADLLLSNIAYLPLAAASELGLPCVAFSCLNWADIFGFYFAGWRAAEPIRQQMLTAYAAADCFIRTEPAMPMPELRSVSVGPIAVSGQSRRTQLLSALDLPGDTRLVLASMGGIETDMSIQRWPRLDGVHYLVLDQAAPARNDVAALSTAEISFSDTLASVDLLLTKPGYGSFSEAAFNRTPVLYVHRQEWPEQPYLQHWLQQQLPCAEISRRQLLEGDFAEELAALLNQTVAPAAPASGLESALALLQTHFKIG